MHRVLRRAPITAVPRAGSTPPRRALQVGLVGNLCFPVSRVPRGHRWLDRNVPLLRSANKWYWLVFPSIFKISDAGGHGLIRDVPGLNPFKTAVSFWGSNHSNSKCLVPSVVLNGLK